MEVPLKAEEASAAAAAPSPDAEQPSAPDAPHSDATGASPAGPSGSGADAGAGVAGDAAPADAVASEDAPSSADEAGQLAEPQVDAALREELESMGFSKPRCLRALHFTGSSSLEAAVNWIVEHEEDPDIDAPLLVPGGARAAPKLTPEEARKKAEELREKARKHKEEEEKRMEREREQERIRAGKELLIAKAKAEDEERKRRIEERRREKEEEQRARQRILQRVEEDKRERRRRLGLPEEDPAPVKAHEPAATATAATRHVSVKPAGKAEKMRDVLRALKQHHKEDGGKVTKAFETMLKYVTNLGQQPDQEKFRRIRISNPVFQERVACFPESLEFLALCGFEKQTASTAGAEGDFLTVSASAVDVAVLQAAAGELHSAISNPFFGVL